jgi:hypothetical protein
MKKGNKFLMIRLKFLRNSMQLGKNNKLREVRKGLKECRILMMRMKLILKILMMMTQHL